MMRKGKTIVCESESGTIIGSSIKQVREDVAIADGQIENQVKSASETVKQAKIVSESEFWEIYDRR